MANTGRVFFFAIVLWGIIGLCAGIQCYWCTSADLPDKCGENFGLNSSHSDYIRENCDNCLKTFIKETKVTIRNCTKTDDKTISFRSGCSSEKINGNDVKTCACNKDLCNASGNLSHSLAVWCYFLLSTIVVRCLNL